MERRGKVLPKPRDPTEIFKTEIAAASYGDPDSDGIFLQNLKKDDEVTFTTMPDRNGSMCVVRLRVVEPKNAAAKIILIKRFLGTYSEEVSVDTDSVVVVRGRRKGKPMEGWVSIANNVYLSGKFTFYFVGKVFINHQKILPCSNITRH